MDNDSTAEELGRIASSHAHAGADMVAPSAMMDGQVAAIRTPWTKGASSLPVMSYSSKFASAFTAPSGTPRAAPLPSATGGPTRWPPSTPGGPEESLTDEEEGADILMVKPSCSTWTCLPGSGRHPTPVGVLPGERRIYDAPPRGRRRLPGLAPGPAGGPLRPQAGRGGHNNHLRRSRSGPDA